MSENIEQINDSLPHGIIKIDNSLKEDIEVLEDLIVAAMHEAKKNADNLSEQEMKSVTGGMPMPPGIKF